jgi:hypothetical protein
MRALTLPPIHDGTNSYRLLSGLMEYQYTCRWVPNNEINSTLAEAADRGWEFVTATCGVQPYDGKFLHYLYFRSEKPG